MNRNNIIYEWQRNRNPFIDRPDLAEFIWGNKAGQTFTLSQGNSALTNIKLFPNPSKGSLQLRNVSGKVNLSIMDVLGRVAYSQEISEDARINHNLDSGIYLVLLQNETGTSVKKLVVE